MIMEGMASSPPQSMWPIMRLKHVAAIRYGRALPKDNRRAEGSVPVYGSAITSGFHDRAFHSKPSIVIGRKGSVGSVQYVDVPFWPIDTVFFLDEVSPIVDLRFLAAALNYFGLDRYKIVVGVPGIKRDDLANFKFPLPPLSEQRRIVEILQEAEHIRHLRAEAEAKTYELIPALFRAFFGETGSNSRGWETVPISHFVESFQGGKSLAGIESDFDVARPRVLKISAVTSGVLNPMESKALPTSYEPPEDHFIRPGDLLITRANTAELVGATALIGSDCPQNLVLPDKIWRFIWRNGFDGTPQFVWALFQEQATRRALGNIASGTGGSMKNISMKKLMQMRVIWPPKEIQSEFSEGLREVTLLHESQQSYSLSADLLASVSAYAFSGQLTAEWRDSHMDDLAREARERDDALNDVGAKLASSRRVADQEEIRTRELSTRGIYAELNREQRGLLQRIQQEVGSLDFVRYFSAQSVSQSIDGPLRGNPQAIEGHLAVFAARGLVIPVSREEQSEDIGDYVFGNAYRLPLKRQFIDDEEVEGLRDYARGSELERLAYQLEKERNLP